MSEPNPMPSNSALRAQAQELKRRYGPPFEARGGHLNVQSSRANHLRTRTTSLELSAEVDWSESRLVEHVHAELMRRSWFSRRWEAIRSPQQAAEMIERALVEWLDAAPEVSL